MTENADTVEVTITEEEKQPKGGSSSVLASKAIQVKLVTRFLTIFTFILSLPILASVVWLLYMRDYNCEKLVSLPKLQIGISIGLIFIFLASNTVVFLRSRYPMPGFLVAMVPLLVMLTMGLALVGAYKMGSRKVLGSPVWLKLKVHNDNNWNNIKSCIYDTASCEDLVLRSLTLKSYDYNMRKLSPIESGCCKPPSRCEMKFVNATYWEKKDGAIDKSNPYDSECDIWRNDETILCYSCKSCKEGFLKTLESKWWKLGFFLVVMALLLILSHLLLFILTMLQHYAK